MLRAPLLFLVLLLPLLEIAGFVIVGSRIGALATVGLVLASAVLGAMLLRHAGVGAMRRMQRDLESGGPPQGQIADSAMLMIAAILFLIPGFLSDLVGLALLVPGIRRALLSRFRDRVTILRSGSRTRADTGARRPGAQPTIDLESDEYRHVEPGNSPWRRSEPREPSEDH